MATFWKSWASLLLTSGLLFTRTGSQQFQLEPLKAAALQGSSVHFIATVQGNWEVMTWKVQSLQVLTVYLPDNIIPSTEQFSARFCPGTGTGCVEFNIHNVTRQQAGTVSCTVQGDFGERTAQLEVQESGRVSIAGGNVSVMQDQQVEFQCVASSWFPTPTVTWTRNGVEVNHSLYHTNSTPDGDYVNSSSVLKFRAVSNTTVQCLATVPTLTTPVSSSVFLAVSPKPPDWTVLIAVVVSIGGFALLVLLIIGILFCYKRRKEKKPNYQDEMMRVRTQSQLSGVRPPGRRQGQVNAAYVPEGRTSVTPSELADSGFFQTNVSHFHETPDVVDGNQVGSSPNQAPKNGTDFGFMKHRHVTIV